MSHFLSLPIGTTKHLSLSTLFCLLAFFPPLAGVFPPAFLPVMAKGGGIGKLGKLKCMIKRWHAASGNHRNLPLPAVGGSASEAPAKEQHGGDVDLGDEKVPMGLHPVYVGKSRRRYLVSSHLVDHPLFRVLVQRSGGAAEDGGGSTTVVGCEVVLFEHLLWMLENADPQSESLDELVEFYAC